MHVPRKTRKQPAAASARPRPSSPGASTAVHVVAVHAPTAETAAVAKAELTVTLPSTASLSDARLSIQAAAALALDDDVCQLQALAGGGRDEGAVLVRDSLTHGQLVVVATERASPVVAAAATASSAVAPASELDAHVRILQHCDALAKHHVGDGGSRTGWIRHATFAELVMSGFACSSLPAMLRAVQAAAALVGDTASSVDLVLFERRVATWEDALKARTQRLRAAAWMELEELKQRFARLVFPGLEAVPIKPMSARLEALLRLLGGLAHGDRLLEPRTPVRDVVAMLGLDDGGMQRERVRMFDVAVAQAAAIGDSALAGRPVQRLTQAMQALDLVTPWPANDDSLFHASLLQAMAVALYNVLVVDVEHLLQREGAQLQSLALPDPTQAWLRQTQGVVHMADGGKVEDERLRRLVADGWRDRVRWMKAYEDSRAISASGSAWGYPWLSPVRTSNENEQARYWFAAEGDLVAEWLFLLRHGGADMTTNDLLTRAFGAWTRGRDVVDGNGAVRIGLNIAHTSAITTYRDATDAVTWPWTHSAAMQVISHLTIAVSPDAPEGEGEEELRVVMMRAFCVEEEDKANCVIGDHCRESMAALDDVAVELCVCHGLLPLLRFALQHETQLTKDAAEPTWDLDVRGPLLEPTVTSTWAFMERALALCASSAHLVQTPSVLQYVLLMLLEDQLPSHVATTFIAALRTTLTTLEDDAIQGILSRPFMFCYASQTETCDWTTLDVLWQLSRNLSAAWSCHAITLVHDLMPLPVMATPLWILKYSSKVPHDVYGFVPAGSEQLLALKDDAAAIVNTHAVYFQRLAAVCKTALLADSCRDEQVASTHREVAMDVAALTRSMSSADVHELVGPLLLRLFAVMRSSTDVFPMNVITPTSLSLLVRALQWPDKEVAASAAWTMADASQAGVESTLWVQLLDVEEMPEGLIEAMAVIKDSTNSHRIASTLAHAMVNRDVRRRSVQVLATRKRRVPVNYNERLMKDLAPVLVNAHKVRTRPVRLHKVLLYQHRGACNCSRPTSSSDRKTTGRSTPASSGVVDSKLRHVQATKIQRQVWRWLYWSARPRVRLRTSWACNICMKTPSILAGLLQSLEPTEPNDPTKPAPIADVEQSLCALRDVSCDRDVAEVIVRDLNVLVTLFRLLAVEAVRDLAVHVLAAFCCRSPAALQFVAPRLCLTSWIHDVLTTAVHVKEPSDCSLLQALSELLLVLPKTQRLCHTLLTVFPAWTRLLPQWNSGVEGDPLFYTRFWLLYQDTIASSQCVANDLAISALMTCDLSFPFTQGVPDAAVVACAGLLWVLCLQAPWRQRLFPVLVALAVPHAIRHVKTLADRLKSTSSQGDRDAFDSAVLHNLLGFLSTVLVDGKHEDVNNDLFKRLWFLHTELSGDSNSEASGEKQRHAGLYFRHPPGTRAAKFAMYGLLPPSLQQFSASTAATPMWTQAVNHQISRLLSLVSCSSFSSHEQKKGALSLCLKHFSHSLRASGAGALFVLETLPQVLPSPKATTLLPKKAVLRAVIQSISTILLLPTSKTGFEVERVERALFTLWELFPRFEAARHVVASHQQWLVELLDSATTPHKIRVTASGLLVQLIKDQQRDRIAAVALHSLCMSIASLCPKLMTRLKSHAPTDPRKLVCPVKKWSPLLLHDLRDDDGSLEVVHTIRWPIKLLRLVLREVPRGAVVFEQADARWLLSLLQQLDHPVLRDMNIRFGQDRLLDVAHILRYAARSVRFSDAMLVDFVSLLDVADLTSPYAEELVRTIQTSLGEHEGTQQFFCTRRRALQGIFQAIGSTESSMSLVAHGLTILVDVLAASASDEAARRVLLDDKQCDLGRIVECMERWQTRMVPRDVDVWRACGKAAALIKALLRWRGPHARVLTPIIRLLQWRAESDDPALKAEARSAHEAAARIVAAHLEPFTGNVQTIAPLARAAIEVVISSDWMSVDKSSSVVRVLRSPLEALALVLTRCLMDNLTSMSTMDQVISSLMKGVACLVRSHVACHSRYIVSFVIERDIIRSLQEARDPLLLRSLVRVIHACSCHPVVHRELFSFRMGDMGEIFARLPDDEWQARVDIALLLDYQCEHTAPNTAAAPITGNPFSRQPQRRPRQQLSFRSAGQLALAIVQNGHRLQCCRACVDTAQKPSGTLSHAAQELESGMLRYAGVVPTAVVGAHLANALLGLSIDMLVGSADPACERLGALLAVLTTLVQTSSPTAELFQSTNLQRLRALLQSPPSPSTGSLSLELVHVVTLCHAVDTTSLFGSADEMAMLTSRLGWAGLVAVGASGVVNALGLVERLAAMHQQQGLVKCFVNDTQLVSRLMQLLCLDADTQAAKELVDTSLRVLVLLSAASPDALSQHLGQAVLGDTAPYSSTNISLSTSVDRSSFATVLVSFLSNLTSNPSTTAASRASAAVTVLTNIARCHDDSILVSQLHHAGVLPQCLDLVARGVQLPCLLEFLDVCASHARLQKLLGRLMAGAPVLVDTPPTTTTLDQNSTEFLRAVPAFALLSCAELQELAARAIEQTVHRGDRLEMPVDGLLTVVVSGIVQWSLHAKDRALFRGIKGSSSWVVHALRDVDDPTVQEVAVTASDTVVCWHIRAASQGTAQKVRLSVQRFSGSRPRVTQPAVAKMSWVSALQRLVVQDADDRLSSRRASSLLGLLCDQLLALFQPQTPWRELHRRTVVDVLQWLALPQLSSTNRWILLRFHASLLPLEGPASVGLTLGRRQSRCGVVVFGQALQACPDDPTILQWLMTAEKLLAGDGAGDDRVGVARTLVHVIATRGMHALATILLDVLVRTQQHPRLTAMALRVLAQLAQYSQFRDRLGGSLLCRRLLGALVACTQLGDEHDLPATVEMALKVLVLLVTHSKMAKQLIEASDFNWVAWAANARRLSLCGKLRTALTLCHVNRAQRQHQWVRQLMIGDSDLLHLLRDVPLGPVSGDARAIAAPIMRFVASQLCTEMHQFGAIDGDQRRTWALALFDLAEAHLWVELHAKPYVAETLSALCVALETTLVDSWVSSSERRGVSAEVVESLWRLYDGTASAELSQPRARCLWTAISRVLSRLLYAEQTPVPGPDRVLRVCDLMQRDWKCSLMLLRNLEMLVALSDRHAVAVASYPAKAMTLSATQWDGVAAVLLAVLVSPRVHPKAVRKAAQSLMCLSSVAPLLLRAVQRRLPVLLTSLLSPASMWWKLEVIGLCRRYWDDDCIVSPETAAESSGHLISVLATLTAASRLQASSALALVPALADVVLWLLTHFRGSRTLPLTCSRVAVDLFCAIIPHLCTDNNGTGLVQAVKVLRVVAEMDGVELPSCCPGIIAHALSMVLQLPGSDTGELDRAVLLFVLEMAQWLYTDRQSNLSVGDAVDADAMHQLGVLFTTVRQVPGFWSILHAYVGSSLETLAHPDSRQDLQMFVLDQFVATTDAWCAVLNNGHLGDRVHVCELLAWVATKNRPVREYLDAHRGLASQLVAILAHVNWDHPGTLRLELALLAHTARLAWLLLEIQLHEGKAGSFVSRVVADVCLLNLKRLVDAQYLYAYPEWTQAVLALIAIVLRLVTAHPGIALAIVRADPSTWSNALVSILLQCPRDSATSSLGLALWTRLLATPCYHFDGSLVTRNDMSAFLTMVVRYILATAEHPRGWKRRRHLGFVALHQLVDGCSVLVRCWLETTRDATDSLRELLLLLLRERTQLSSVNISLALLRSCLELAPALVDQVFDVALASALSKSAQSDLPPPDHLTQRVLSIAVLAPAVTIQPDVATRVAARFRELWSIVAELLATLQFLGMVATARFLCSSMSQLVELVGTGTGLATADVDPTVQQLLRMLWLRPALAPARLLLQLCLTMQSHPMAHFNVNVIELLRRLIDVLVDGAGRLDVVTLTHLTALVTEILGVIVRYRWVLGQGAAMDDRVRYSLGSAMAQLLVFQQDWRCPTQALLCWTVEVSEFNCISHSGALAVHRIPPRVLRLLTRLLSAYTAFVDSDSDQDSRQLPVWAMDGGLAPIRLALVPRSDMFTLRSCLWTVLCCVDQLTAVAEFAAVVRNNAGDLLKRFLNLLRWRGRLDAQLVEAATRLLLVVLRGLELSRDLASLTPTQLVGLYDLLVLGDVEVVVLTGGLVRQTLKSPVNRRAFVDALAADASHCDDREWHVVRRLHALLTTAQRPEDAVLQTCYGLLAELAKEADALPFLHHSEGDDKTSLLSTGIAHSSNPGVCVEQAKFVARMCVDDVACLLVRQARGTLECLLSALAIPEAAPHSCSAWQRILVLPTPAIAAVVDAAAAAELRQMVTTHVDTLVPHLMCVLAANPSTSLLVRRSIYDSVAILDALTTSTASVQVPVQRLSVHSRLPRVLLTAITQPEYGGEHADAAHTMRCRALQVVWRLCHDSAVVQLFHSRSGERTVLLTLLRTLLQLESATDTPAQRDAIVQHCLRILQLVAADRVAADHLLTSDELRAAVLHHLSVVPPRLPVLELVWSVLFQLTTHGPLANDLLASGLHQSRLAVLETAIQWTVETLPLATVFVATLRNVALAYGVGDTHNLCLTALPIVHKLVGAPDLPLPPETLGHLADFLASVLHASAQRDAIFLQCVLVMRRLMQLCERDALLETQGDATVEAQPARAMWPSAAQTLLTALCSLLLHFLTTEAEKPVLPGFSVTVGSSASRTKRLRVRVNSTGVFTNATSPDDNNQRLIAVLEVLFLCCTSPIVGAGSITSVAAFFQRACETPSGRFLLLSPLVVSFWSLLVPSLSCSAIHTVHTALLRCATSRSHVRRLVSGGAIRWSVCTTVVSVARGLQSIQAEHLAATAFCDFVTLVGLLTERPVFLATPDNVVRAFAKADVSVGALLLAAVWFACRRGQRGRSVEFSWLSLACAVVARCFAVLPMTAISKLLTETPSALAHVFGWNWTQQDLVRLLLTVVEETMPEARMKCRTLVQVVHCTLWHASQAGLVAKGMPEHLRDHRLAHITRAVDALTAVLPLVTTHAHRHSSAADTNAEFVRCLGALELLVAEVAQFAHSELEVVYRAFEDATKDVEMLAVMATAQQAIKLSQGAFYSVQLTKEALMTALSSNEAASNDVHAVESFLAVLLRVFEWLVVALQHRDIDRSFYGHQLHQLQSLLETLLAIPVTTRERVESFHETDATGRASLPVFLRVHSLELYSRWVWLGLRPYLVIQSPRIRQCIRFTKALEVTERRPFHVSMADAQSSYRRHYHGVSNDVKTSTHALQHALDVQVRLYLPFWPQDATLGHLTLSLPSNMIDADAQAFKVYSSGSGATSKVLGAILLGASTSSTTYAPSLAKASMDMKYPPYSTCGSNVVRCAAQELLRVVATFFRALKQLLAGRKAPERRQTLTQVSTRDHDVSVEEHVQVHIRALMQLLRRATDAKKMLGTYEGSVPAVECTSLVDSLETLSGPFANAVAHAFQVKSLTASFWEQLGAAVTTAASCFMPDVDVFFFGLRRIKDPGATLAIGATESRDVFCELSSQCQLGNVVEHAISGSAPEVLLAHMQDSGQGTDWRPLLPLVSVWTLHYNRLPVWESFERMQAPTSLTHLLLHPIERLQIYIAVVQCLKPAIMTQPRATHVLRPPVAMLAPAHPTNASDKNKRVHPHDGTKDLSMRPSERIGSNHGWLSALTSMMQRSWRRRTVHHALLAAPLVEDVTALERTRYARLRIFHSLDPFSASRLQRLHRDASSIPSRLYRTGVISTGTYWVVWGVILLTLWRWSAALEAISEATAFFDDVWRTQAATRLGPGAHTARKAHGKERRVLLQGKHKRFLAPESKKVSATIAPATKEPPHVAKSIALTVIELQRLVLLVEAKHLVSDVCRVWPPENGNLGLGGFWSTSLFAAIAYGFPVLFVTLLVPHAVSHDRVSWLSPVACVYAALLILLALVSILWLARRLPAFREVRQVTSVNLTELPDCWRNYLVLVNVFIECCQLNTTSLSVWKDTYQPEQFVSAIATIDISDFGVDFAATVDFFAMRQHAAFTGLVLWWLVLKASNKFKAIPFINHTVTFVLPNLLSGPLFMFLAKQFYTGIACGETAVPGQYVLHADLYTTCWQRRHLVFAVPSLIGMGVFVPVATLAFGSSQVFFPQVNVDLQTAPLLNVASQIVKASMIGARAFFVTHVRVYLGVALFGNLCLFALVCHFTACCSVWHLRYLKLFVYAMSSWSALCALVSTFVSDDVRRSVPSYGLHGGWGTLLLLFAGLAWRRIQAATRAPAGPTKPNSIFRQASRV